MVTAGLYLHWTVYSLYHCSQNSSHLSKWILSKGYYWQSKVYFLPWPLNRGRLKTKLYDKRDDFTFPIVNFPSSVATFQHHLCIHFRLYTLFLGVCTVQWLGSVPIYWLNPAIFLYPSSPKGKGGILFYLCLSFRPSILLSVQDIFRRTFLSNCWWQRSDIWSQASYRDPISWEAFLDPSDSYFLFADFVDFYTHWTYMLIFRRIFYTPSDRRGRGGILFYVCPSFRPSKIFFVTFFSVTVDGRNLIFGHKHHIGIPYCG
jgi:hypothetical protein